jgi:hypothetical protein
MLCTVVTDTEAGTRAIESGKAQQSLRDALERLKPEAAYFYLENGKRTTLFVLDLAACADIVPLVEPLFALLKAEVSLTPVMTFDDLTAGFQAHGGS